MMKWFIAVPCLSSFCLFAEPVQEDLQESLYLRRIAEYWKEGDFAAAKSRIHNFLLEHPHSSYADHLKAMLGDLFLKEGNFAKALEAYQGIEDPKWQEKISLSLLQCFYHEKRYDQLLSASRLFLEKDQGSLEDKNLVRFLHAEAHYFLGEKAETIEQKQRFFEEAISHYQVLKSTSYHGTSLYPLATMHRALEHHKEAAAYYQELSFKSPENAEEFLFQAAISEAKFNPKAAIETFAKVYPFKGRFAAEAAFYEIELLFQEDRFQDLLSAYGKTAKMIDAKRLIRVDYYVGRSLFAVGNYELAISTLQKCLKTPHLSAHTLKNILITLSLSAEKVGDALLFKKAAKELYGLFGTEREVAEVLILHAQFCQKKGDLEEAKKVFELLSDKFATHPSRETILYDYGLLLEGLKEWKEAEILFDKLLIEFPNTKHLSLARRHQIFCLFEHLKAIPVAAQTQQKGQLVHAIQKAMEDNSVFSKGEKRQIHYLLGKTLYDLNQFDDALTTLTEFIHLYPKDAHTKQAHLLMAYSHLKGSHDDLLFVMHAEKALEQHALVSKPGALHLELYNAYLNLAEKESAQGKGKMIDEAALHLFAAIEEPLSKDNLFWLEQYFERKLPESEHFLDKAITVLEKVLSATYASHLEPLEKETATLKLSAFYEQANLTEKQTAVLKKLHEEQQDNKEVSWKYPRRVIFELAKSYEKRNDTRKALDLYDFLITSSTLTPSYFGPAAELQKLSLLYTNLSSKEDPQVQEILDGLKSLEIRRKLSSEPTHLEAALIYIAIKTELSPQDNQVKLKLHLLNTCRETLLNQKDPITESYLSVAAHYPEEKHLFDDYMDYLSAEAMRMEGIMHGSEELAKAALHQLESIEKRPIHPSLKKWVEMSKGARGRIR